MYLQSITGEHKGLFILLLDQSYSMIEPSGNSNNQKMDVLAQAINNWLTYLAIRCSGRDYYDVALLGYRTDRDANPIIESVLGGELAGKMLVSITEISKHPARVEKKTKQFFDDETGELCEADLESLVWVEPKAEGGTPMCSVLCMAHEIASQWIEEHPRSFPPMVFHITDGESQDGDPIPHADRLRELETEDGKLLLYNCHLSTAAADAIRFPHCVEILPDDEARTLFKMSSLLPKQTFQVAQDEGIPVQAAARGMCFNADIDTLCNFLRMPLKQPARRRPAPMLR